MSTKLNLHQHLNEFKPCADVPTPGSSDFCFTLDDGDGKSIDEIKQNLTS